VDEGNVTERVPLALWKQAHWEVTGARDPEAFFGSIGSCLPTATHLFLEGTSQADAVHQVLEKHQVAGPYLPERQTTWPAPKQWRLSFSSALLLELSRLAAAHAQPELTDHLFIYDGDAAVVEWPDAFAPGAPILISGAVPREAVQSLSGRLGATVRRIDGAAQQGVEADEA
jgi:hypothetical protein